MLEASDKIVGVIAAQRLLERYLRIQFLGFCAGVAVAQDASRCAHVGAGIECGFRIEVVGGPVADVDLNHAC